MPCGPAQASSGIVKRRLDLHGLGIDHCNCARRCIIAGTVDLWNVLIKFPGPRTPSALLEAVGGVRGCHSVPSNTSVAKRPYSRGRDEGDEGRRLSAGTRDHDHVIFRIVAEFVGSGRACRPRFRPRSGSRLRPVMFLDWPRSVAFMHPDLPRAVSDPKLRAGCWRSTRRRDRRCRCCQ